MITPKFQLNQRHNTFACAPDVNKLCQPLFAEGFIHSFWYCSVDEHKNTLAILTTTPECNKAILESGLAPNPEELHEGIHYLPVSQCSRQRVEINKAYGLYNILEMVVKEEGVKRLYGFSTSQPNFGAVNQFFNRLDQLKTFITNFNQQATDLIKYAEAKPIQLAPLNQLRATSSKIHFSTREQQILEVLGDGLSAKMIGKRLGISHRTVEEYIMNIKKKLGVRTREEVVSYYCLFEKN